jgi:hypothetical protein
MGHSPSIKELQQKEDQFRTYLQKIQKELETRAAEYEDKMNAGIDKFYTQSNWKPESYISGRNIDFMQASSWSMDNIKAVIDAVAKVVVGGGKPPEGVTITPPKVRRLG